MSKCKNCEHEIVERKAIKTGKPYLEHKGMIVAGVYCSHGFECDCTNPEPEATK